MKKNLVICIVIAVAVQAYAQTVEEIKSKALQGDANAQYLLGKRYENGQGVEANIPEANIWYRKASEQGNAVAQYNLGWNLKEGSGVPKNFSEAVKWLRKSAEQGNADGQFWLGMAYSRGEGVRVNEPEAFKLFLKAAEQGQALAQLKAGLDYADGSGGEKNPAEAVKWLRKASVNETNKEVPDLAKEALKDPSLAVHVVKQEASDIVDNLSKTISDTEPEKYGGPKTPIVIRLALGGQKSDAAGNLAVMVQGKMASRFKEIKRGQPLTSLISVKIPTGTKVYPIRLVISEEAGSVDYYFYKDEFGDWAAVEK